ncbi:MAG: histidine phosphatase family protein, partial [Oscillospiraceae bacterium]|nr:histidine phosphatase family protein [Oscillospiraceae bacterium]
YSLGCWENIPWTEWAARDNESLLRFNQLNGFSPLGGETPEQVRQRITEEFWRIAKENEGKTVAIVSHGMALRILMGALEGLSFAEMRTAPHGDNTAVSLVEVEGNNARIVFRDDNSHLGELSTFAKQAWWRKDNNAPDPALRFRRYSKDHDADLLAVLDAARAEGVAPAFDAATYREVIRLAYWQDKVAGVVIPTEEDCWFYLLPALRGKRQGIQLIGEGIDALRREGCDTIRCNCISNSVALYLTHYGFDRNGLTCSLKIDFSL